VWAGRRAGYGQLNRASADDRCLEPRRERICAISAQEKSEVAGISRRAGEDLTFRSAAAWVMDGCGVATAASKAEISSKSWGEAEYL